MVAARSISSIITALAGVASPRGRTKASRNRARTRAPGSRHVAPALPRGAARGPVVSEFGRAVTAFVHEQIPPVESCLLAAREFRGGDGVNRAPDDRGFDHRAGIQSHHGGGVEQRVEQPMVRVHRRLLRPHGHAGQVGHVSRVPVLQVGRVRPHQDGAVLQPGPAAQCGALRQPRYGTISGCLAATSATNTDQGAAGGRDQPRLLGRTPLTFFTKASSRRTHRTRRAGNYDALRVTRRGARRPRAAGARSTPASGLL